MDDVLDFCEKRLHKKRHLVEEGLVINEICGITGLHHIVVMTLDKF